MRKNLYVVTLVSLLVAPPILATVVEQMVWAKDPPVGEITGLPSALLVPITFPFILVCGATVSLVLKLFHRGSAKSYLLAFIIPSMLHALLFTAITVRLLTEL